MEHTWRIVTSEEDFQKYLETIDLTKAVAVDTETKGTRPTQKDSRLLGVAITSCSIDGNYSSIYLPWGLNRPRINLDGFQIVGWNVPFDKAWLDYTFSIDTKWHADGRIMWHLQNNDPTIRGFGLKLAQRKILGWSESNDKELEENVASKGGSLRKGDHYKADLEVLAKYACLDTYSTLLCYEKLSPFISDNQYQKFQEEILDYAILLSQAANQGLPVDEVEIRHAVALYTQRRERSKVDIREVCSNEISAIERTWNTQRASTYKSDRGRERFLSAPEKHRRFNPSSTHQRALLLHTMLEFPVHETTPTGLPKTDRANIALIKHPSASILTSYSEYKKVAEMAATYLGSTVDGRMYTNYDVCGTVSGRLAGFKPSVLNMPFSEKDVMHAFKCEPGYSGIHADLAAIEPCILAYYSEDPALLKVYRNSLGDIYLDLGLELFPGNVELKEGYNPNVPITSEVKERFKDIRAICKTIHLAVSYTGTYITVAKNLTKAGYPTTKGAAMALVKSYWRKFNKVKAFESRLFNVYNQAGQLRNVCGRIITVPDIYKKDLMNRLVQSSAHDVLRLWVIEIIKEFNVNTIDWKHWLPDLHDSTTFMIKEGDEDRARLCYENALKSVEDKLKLTVPLKMELRFVKTLAGLKSKE